MKRVLSLGIALCAALTSALAQQQQPQDEQGRGYHVALCIKVRDGKMPDFRDYLRDASKLAQTEVDSGRYTAAYLFRTVLPGGNQAACDYTAVYVFPGPPSPPTGPEELGKLLQKAGIKMTAQDYIARRAALSQLVSAGIWRTALAVGAIEKGDYVFINHMKVHDIPSYMEMERTIWKPMAEAWVKDGTLRGWLVTRPVLPAGTGLQYQATSVDVLPNWDCVFKDWPIETTFKQVHPDKNLEEVFDKFGKSRDLALRELMVVEEKAVPAAKSSTGGGE